jgi:cell division protein ZipA
MEYLRWILLSIAVVVVAGVYLWSRSKKQRTSYYSPLDAANDAPSFSAGKQHGKDWVDGVGPVRVAREDNDINEVLASIKEDARPGSKLARLRRETMLRNVANQFAKTKVTSNTADDDSAVDDSDQSRDSNQSSNQTTSDQAANRRTAAVEDDLVALYLVAQRGEQIKGEQILSASYAVHLEFGDKDIFHRKDNNGNVLFSMASMQEPGYFDVNNMHNLRTRGITLFTQLSFCEQPVRALDEMLVCAHSLASMLGVQVCNADRKLLDEGYTLGLRAKARQFAE